MRHSLKTITTVGLLAAGLCSGAFAQAVDDCSPIRLDQNGGPFEEMPVRDQGSSDLCYAYSTAQLVDAWRYSNGARNVPLVSPVLLGVEVGPDGSTIAAAYERLRTAGGCDDAAVTAFIAGGASGGSGDVPNPYDMFVRAGARACPNAENAGEGLSCAVRQACGFRMNLSALPALGNVRSAGDLSAIKRTLDRQLEAGVPLAMSYCMSALHDKNYRSYDDEGRAAPGGCSDGKHASIIIGRRPEVDSHGVRTCRYLVRNTFGPCENTSPNNYGAACENGQFWMDVVHNAYELYYISGH